MAKKKAPKMNAAPARLKPVRLDLKPEDYERLERQAEKRGLNKASYARMIVLERLSADERLES
ncbi:hypothetical protein [Paludisphaera rhizosphaerae]|uniref:hypothetical protein n=1 Tax=Paludisphaera rhizosphaerae TaxID=2711216 RepID=UPI0013EC20CF|nr:hypothetical protein [Paludisphaera rhizosphaerae]